MDPHRVDTHRGHSVEAQWQAQVIFAQYGKIECFFLLSGTSLWFCCFLSLLREEDNKPDLTFIINNPLTPTKSDFTFFRRLEEGVTVLLKLSQHYWMISTVKPLTLMGLFQSDNPNGSMHPLLESDYKGRQWPHVKERRNMEGNNVKLEAHNQISLNCQRHEAETCACQHNCRTQLPNVSCSHLLPVE